MTDNRTTETALNRVHFNEYGDYLDRPYVVRCIKALEQLVRDMWVELCCSSSGFDVKKQVDELGERMTELGIEVK